MSGWFPVIAVLVAAVLVDARRRRAVSRDTASPSRARGRALFLITGLVAGFVMLGQPAFAQPLSCKESPEPDRPGSGLVGSLDPPTLSAGEPGSVYHESSYAGLIWHNYDLGCAGTAVFNPASTTDTWLGNQTFNVAKFVVGGVNWAHYLIVDKSGAPEGHDLLAPLDNLITTATTAMYDAVFTTWLGPVLAVLAVVLLVLAMRGDLAQQAQRVMFALGALVLASGAYLAPIQWSKAADSLLLDGVADMQEGFLAQTGLGDRDTLPTVLVDQVLYQNWLRGEFGAADVPQALDLGRPLLRAQAFTKLEVEEGRADTALGQQKKTEFATLAGQMGDRYPYFQGKSGSRVGAGALAVLQAVCIALFQLLSKVLVLMAMLIIRLMVMTAPAIAVVAILKPDILPALLRVGGAALVNTLIVGALAGLHALMVISLFRPGAGIDLWLAMLVTGVVTVVLWAVARPFRRLVSMVSLTRDQFGGIVPGAGTGPMSRVWQRMRGGTDDDRQTRWWDERREAGGADGPGGGARPETEPLARVRATAERVPQPRASVESAWPRRQPVALPSGVAEPAPTWGTPDVDDRVIYRRPEAVPLRPGGIHPITPEIVDGQPVYRIYRPRSGSRGT